MLHTSTAYFPAHLTTVACVSPYCAHVFCVMQVTTGMHNIRAYKADETTESLTWGGGGGERLSSLIKLKNCLIDCLKKKSFLETRLGQGHTHTKTTELPVSKVQFSKL